MRPECERSAFRSRVLPVVVPVGLFLIHVSPVHPSDRTLRPRTSQDTTTIRDSAGVRIVENRAPAWARGNEWLVANQPTVTIGAVEGGEHEVLSHVVGAVRLSDGTIAVGDASAFRVNIYDATGRYMTSFGGSGAGPGEFGLMGLIGRLHGDSIGVWDRRRKRVTVFSKTGQARTGTSATVAGEIVPAIGWRDDGSVIVTSTITFGEALSAEPGEGRTQNHFIRVSPDGASETTLVLPGQEVLVTRSGRSYLPQKVLFGRDSYLAVSAAGFVSGENSTFELRKRSWDGRLIAIIRKSGSAKAVTDSDLAIANANAERTRQQMLRVAGAPARGADAEALANSKVPHRSTHPYFDDLVIDASDHVWARESSVQTGTQSWFVFGPDGIWLGTVSLPGNLKVTDIGEDYILGTCQDELGVESVQLYELDRRR